MPSNFQTTLINICFTIALLLGLTVIAIEGERYFLLKTRSFGMERFSDFKNYKVKYVDNLISQASYDISQSNNFSGYEGKPTSLVKSVSNIYNFEDQALEENPQNPVREIIENPLLRGYYAQLGIFSSKEAAEESIKILALKGILNDDFTSYIEVKNIKSKILYLAEIGVFSTKEDAVTFCNKLRKLQIGCLVID